MFREGHIDSNVINSMVKPHKITNFSPFSLGKQKKLDNMK